MVETQWLRFHDNSTNKHHSRFDLLTQYTDSTLGFNVLIKCRFKVYTNVHLKVHLSLD